MIAASLKKIFLPKIQFQYKYCSNSVAGWSFKNFNGNFNIYCCGMDSDDIERFTSACYRNMVRYLLCLISPYFFKKKFFLCFFQFLTKQSVPLFARYLKVSNGTLPKYWCKGKHNINTLRISQSNFERIESNAFQTFAFVCLRRLKFENLPITYFENGTFNGSNHLNVLILCNLDLFEIDRCTLLVTQGYCNRHLRIAAHTKTNHALLFHSNQIRIRIDQTIEIIRVPIISMKIVPIRILVFLTASGLAIVSGGFVSLMIKLILRFLVRNTDCAHSVIIRCVLYRKRAKVRTLIDFWIAHFITWIDQFNR